MYIDISCWLDHQLRSLPTNHSSPSSLELLQQLPDLLALGPLTAEEKKPLKDQKEGSMTAMTKIQALKESTAQEQTKRAKTKKVMTSKEAAYEIPQNL